MAQIDFFSNGNPLGGIDHSLRRYETAIVNYWGNLANEISFPIDCKLLARLKNISPTGHVALRIENIATPATVLATWVTFNNNILPSDSAFYRVLSTTEINSLCTDGNVNYRNRIIDARLAKPFDGSDFFVLFHKSGLINRKGSGGGGTVEGAGVTVR